MERGLEKNCEAVLHNSSFHFQEAPRKEEAFSTPFFRFTTTTTSPTMQLRCGAARGGLASSRTNKNVSNGGRVRGAMLSAPRSFAATTLNAYVGLAACNALHTGVVSRSASAPFGAAVRSSVRRGRGAVGCRAMFERFTEVRDERELFASTSDDDRRLRPPLSELACRSVSLSAALLSRS